MQACGPGAKQMSGGLDESRCVMVSLSVALWRLWSLSHPNPIIGVTNRSHFIFAKKFKKLAMLSIVLSLEENIWSSGFVEGQLELESSNLIQKKKNIKCLLFSCFQIPF